MLLSMKNGNFYTFLVSKYIFGCFGKEWQERKNIGIVEAIEAIEAIETIETIEVMEVIEAIEAIDLYRNEL